jgi:protein-S-isoprenylcysteine O-methyltransferase Ste14
MEILQIIPLLSFLVFCIQLVCKIVRLKRNKILISEFKPTVKTIFFSVLLFGFFAIFVSELLFQSLLTPFSILPSILQYDIYLSTIVKLIGVVLLVLSVLTMQLTLMAFKNSLRFGLDDKNLGKLISSGIFSYSRNPFFLSILLLFLGISMVFSTPFFIGIFVLSLLFIHLSIVKEEKFMLENYGEEYNEYAKKVRRYF